MNERPQTIRLLVLHTNGSGSFIVVPHLLDSFQRLVGGVIEVFQLPPKWQNRHLVGICNEEGMMLNLPANPFSYTILGPPAANYGAPVLGNVLIVRSNGEEFTSLTRLDEEALQSVMIDFWQERQRR